MVQQQLPTGFRDDIGAVAERKDDVSLRLLWSTRMYLMAMPWGAVSICMSSWIVLMSPL